MPSRLHQNTLLRRQVQASYHWCRAHTTTTKEDCCYLPFLASHRPRAYVINWPRVHKKWKCPVEGCPYQVSTNANFHNHFMYRHPYDSIHLTNESLEPWDKCELCGPQCPLPTLRSHTESATCIRGWITKRSRDIANKILQADE